jgi:hypothetical protein
MIIGLLSYPTGVVTSGINAIGHLEIDNHESNKGQRSRENYRMSEHYAGKIEN